MEYSKKSRLSEAKSPISHENLGNLNRRSSSLGEFAENFGQAMNKSSQPLISIKSQLKMSFDAIELRDTNPEKQFV
jgi:hypothetical protein